MLELIDKNALQEALKEEYNRHKALYDEIGHIERGGIVQGLSYAKMILCKQPKIEPEVRRGRWLPCLMLKFRYECGFCGEPSNYPPPYCPNCGARMDGGADEEPERSGRECFIPCSYCNNKYCYYRREEKEDEERDQLDP